MKNQPIPDQPLDQDPNGALNQAAAALMAMLPETVKEC